MWEIVLSVYSANFVVQSILGDSDALLFHVNLGVVNGGVLA